MRRVSKTEDGAQRLVREGRNVLQLSRGHSRHRSRAGADRGGFRIEDRADGGARDGGLPAAIRRAGTIFRAVAISDPRERSLRRMF